MIINKFTVKRMFVGMMALTFFSCSDEYLDKQIDISETQERVYEDSLKVAGVVNMAYGNIQYSFMYNRWSQYGLDVPSKEAEGRGEETKTGKQFAKGTINPSSVDNVAWTTTYNRLRGINIFMNNYNNGTVAKIKCTDPNRPDDVLVTSTIEYWKGQMFFLRAWYLFNMIRHYGGIPLIEDKVYSESEVINVPRNTYEECVDYVVQQCDSAYIYLVRSGHEWNYGGFSPPVDVDGGIPNGDGRACGMAALALKARMLLYAASPLVNCERSDDPGHLVSYGNEDRNRWKLAYDAAKSVIDKGYYALSKPARSSNTEVTLWWPSFYHMFMEIQSLEQIFCYMPSNKDSGIRLLLERFVLPNSRATRFSNQLTCFPTQELVDAFPMKDGYPRGDARSQYAYSDGDGMYDNRDERLKATVSFNGAYRLMTGYREATMKTYTGAFITSGNLDQTSAYKDGIYQVNATTTGYYRMKAIRDDPAEGYNYRPYMLIRYTEILMIAAEAANEYFGGPTAEVYEYLRAIRDRAEIEEGGPQDRYGITDNMSQSDMRKFIYNERFIEFAFEEHRFWDVRRWKIADETENGPTHGMEITRQEDETFSYRRIEVSQHKFTDKMYWWPIPITEMSKSDALIQNPGY
jgi:hypothetical protein